LSFDDFFVMIPCDQAGAVNAPTVSASSSQNTICAGDQISLSANGADLYTWIPGGPGSNIVDTPLGSVVYTVVGTNTLTGCTNQQVIPVIVNPSPGVFAVTDKTEICPGETAHLTGYFADSYAWTTGSGNNPISVSPTVTTTYSVIGTNILGCSKTAAVTVAVKSLPNITVFAANNPEICPGEAVNITASGASTYMWSSSSSPALFQGNPLNVTFGTTTTFTVVGTGTNGCSNKSTLSQNVGNCNGMSELQNWNGLSVYPNPMTSAVTVKSDNGMILNIEITDVSGRVILSTPVNGDRSTVDVSSLSNGIYYARIYGDQSVQVLKLTKN
jgi:hypothetical protein